RPLPRRDRQAQADLGDPRRGARLRGRHHPEPGAAGKLRKDRHSMRTTALLLALLALGAQEQAPDKEGLAFFESKIRPVLIDRCSSCHSAEAKKLKGGLYVDSREGLLKGGETGPSIVPGDPEKSLLVHALRYKDELKMPPKGKLAPEVVADFEAWVKRGAP